MTQIKTLLHKLSKTTNNFSVALELNSKKIQGSNYKYKVLMVYSCKLFSLGNHVHHQILLFSLQTDKRFRICFGSVLNSRYLKVRFLRNNYEKPIRQLNMT